VLAGLVEDAPDQPALSLEEAMEALPELELPLVPDDPVSLTVVPEVGAELSPESPEEASTLEVQDASPDATFSNPLTGDEPEKT